MEEKTKRTAEAYVRGLHKARYGHLEHRFCSKVAPMPDADRDRFRWHHPDAVMLGPLLNLVECRCPNCGLKFTCFPESSNREGQP